MASCAPRNAVKPSATTSKRLLSMTLNTARSMSRTKTFVVTRAPASLHTCAAATSRGNPLRPNTPASGHAARWWPSGSSWRPHQQVREDRGKCGRVDRPSLWPGRLGERSLLRIETLGELSRRPSSQAIRARSSAWSPNSVTRTVANRTWAGLAPLLPHGREPPLPGPSNQEGGILLTLPCSAGPQPNTVQDLGQIRQSSPLPQTGAFVGPWPVNRPNWPSAQHDGSFRHWQGPNLPMSVATKRTVVLPQALPGHLGQSTNIATRFCRATPRMATSTPETPSAARSLLRWTRTSTTAASLPVGRSRVECAGRELVVPLTSASRTLAHTVGAQLEPQGPSTLALSLATLGLLSRTTAPGTRILAFAVMMSMSCGSTPPRSTPPFCRGALRSSHGQTTLVG